MSSYSFSIITVCKNDLESLKHTHQSVQEQTLQDFEWVVIDGNSTDGTVEFLKALKVERTLWLSRPDNGLYDAMNSGLTRASCDYLIFLNAGDCLASKDSLTKVDEALMDQHLPPNLVYGNALVIYPNGKECFEKARPPSYFPIGLPIYHQAFFYRRAAIENIKFQHERYQIAADYAFTLECIQKYPKILQVSFPVCRFALGGVSSKNTSLILREVWIAQRDILHASLGMRLISYLIHWVAMMSKEFTPGIYRGFHYLYQKIN